MHHRALSSFVVALTVAVLPHGAAAQYAGGRTESRAPRFLLAMAERAAPVPVDLRRSAILRHPLSLDFDGVPLKEALAEISRQARIGLVYADDDLPVGMTVSLPAGRLTRAAALTDLLLDPRVDGAFTPDGRATLGKPPPGPAVRL